MLFRTPCHMHVVPDTESTGSVKSQTHIRSHVYANDVSHSFVRICLIWSLNFIQHVIWRGACHLTEYVIWHRASLHCLLAQHAMPFDLACHLIEHDGACHLMEHIIWRSMSLIFLRQHVLWCACHLMSKKSMTFGVVCHLMEHVIRLSMSLPQFLAVKFTQLVTHSLVERHIKLIIRVLFSTFPIKNSIRIRPIVYTSR